MTATFTPRTQASISCQYHGHNLHLFFPSKIDITRWLMQRPQAQRTYPGAYASAREKKQNNDDRISEICAPKNNNAPLTNKRRYLSANMSVFLCEFKAAVHLNNTGVSLLKRRCYRQAMATLSDAIAILKAVSARIKMTNYCRPQSFKENIFRKLKTN